MSRAIHRAALNCNTCEPNCGVGNVTTYRVRLGSSARLRFGAKCAHRPAHVPDQDLQ